jgi:hypothetical protein
LTEEDENFREEHNLERPQSHEANLDLIVKHLRYLKALEQASASDKQVRNKWDEWKEIKGASVQRGLRGGSQDCSLEPVPVPVSTPLI